MLRVVTIVGTRPEIIRLSRVIARLDKTFDHHLVHTGQNYDYELNQVFFDELGLKPPKIVMKGGTDSLGALLGGILAETEKALIQLKPDAVLLLGDTNSALSAIIAKRLKIPVYHMEAGNRCFDANVPEEINRRLVDSISDFNLVYTEHARRHLLSEGHPHRRVYLTGSPMKEVLDFYQSDIQRSEILSELGLTAGDYFLASIHREENVDNPKVLKQLLRALGTLADRFDRKIVVSAHPRTRKRLEALSGIDMHRDVLFMKPFGFFDYNNLQLNAACVLSDSGTITEESALLGFPAVTLRSAIERPEGLDTGSIMLTGSDAQSVVLAVETAVNDHERGETPPVPEDYWVDNVSQRVTRLIVSTAKLSNLWAGVVEVTDE